MNENTLNEENSTSKIPGKDLRDTFEEGYQSESFTRDFKKYSQDYQDNESRVPGTNNDYALSDGGTQQWIGLRALKADEPQTIIPTPAHMGKSDRVYTPMDERLREGIYMAFTDDEELDASDIGVDVKNGIVTLTGTVSAVSMRSLAEDRALAIPGVESVENQLADSTAFSDR